MVEISKKELFCHFRKASLFRSENFNCIYDIAAVFTGRIGVYGAYASVIKGRQEVKGNLWSLCVCVCLCVCVFSLLNQSVGLWLL